MRIVLTSPYYARHDAIGNDIRLTQAAFKKKGYEAHIYAPMMDKGLEDKCIPESHFVEIIKDPNAIWLYHHGVFWSEADLWLAQAKCKVVMKYHNVTPADFFTLHDPIGEGATRLGREQTARLVQSGKFSHYIPASPYNASELEDLGVKADDITIIAPFNTLKEFDDCELNQDLHDSLKNNGLINVLMIGRVAPNKGHRHMIETMRVYFEMYGPNLKLHLAGTISPNFQTYAADLAKLADQYELGAYLNFTNSLAFNDLYTYYRAADIFLCLSEHEGFCLPIIEAQYLELPVLTVNRCAMGDTVGAGQIIWDYYDHEFYAKAIHRIQNNIALRNQLVESGKANAQLYSSDRLAEQHYNLLDYFRALDGWLIN